MSPSDKSGAPTGQRSGRPPSGKAARSQARERLAAERAAQAAAQRRRDRMLRIGLVALVVLVVIAIGAAVIASRKPSVDTNAANPPGVTATKGYPFGTVQTPVLDVYEDFQCPNCKAFEAANGAQIEALATDGKAKVVYHVISILDSLNGSGNTARSSTRSAAAGGCAQAQGKFLQFHNAIYAAQPKEGVGYTDAALQQIGTTAGVPDQSAFDQCVTSGKYIGFVSQVNAEADQRQVVGTPMFFVNGQQVNTSAAKSWNDVGRIVIQAVDQAK
jgi:protein-disulfide isomerase